MTEKPEDDIKNLRRTHVDLGLAMVDQAIKDGELPDQHPFIALMRDIMLNHHEQMDGKGFRGIKGDALSLPVRLACIVESYDGYSIARPHFGDRDISPEGVLARMRDDKGADLYDMELFNAFAQYKRDSIRKGSPKPCDHLPR
jgi:HD-GYP domain-containing protein (c-di-GMP phosphodiesterase class II)